MVCVFCGGTPVRAVRFTQQGVPVNTLCCFGCGAETKPLQCCRPLRVARTEQMHCRHCLRLFTALRGTLYCSPVCEAAAGQLALPERSA